MTERYMVMISHWPVIFFSAFLCLAQPSYGKFISFAEFKKKSLENKNIRCEATNVTTCNKALKSALMNRLIDTETFYWAAKEGLHIVLNHKGEVDKVCACGCFAAGTQILVSSTEFLERREESVSFLYQNHESSLLRPLAITDRWSRDFTDELIPRDIDRFTVGEEQKRLVVFHLANNRKLKLTTRHGVVIADGRIIAAEDIKLSDGLLSPDGDLVSIDAITRELTKGRVYNFLLRESIDGNTDPHVVVAEGVLVGDLIWQNRREAELGSILIRDNSYNGG